MKAPIHSTKHYVQTSLSTVAAGALLTTVLINGVSILNKNLVSEVEEGASVKAIYIELWVIGTAGTATQITTLTKFPSGQTPFSVAEMAALGAADNKKNILFTSQGLVGNDGISNPNMIIRQWFKIPKGKQRFGLGDTLELQIFAQAAESLSVCGFATYKEYT